MSNEDIEFEIPESCLDVYENEWSVTVLHDDVLKLSRMDKHLYGYFKTNANKVNMSDSSKYLLFTQVLSQSEKLFKCANENRTLIHAPEDAILLSDLLGDPKYQESNVLCEVIKPLETLLKSSSKNINFKYVEPKHMTWSSDKQQFSIVSGNATRLMELENGFNASDGGFMLQPVWVAGRLMDLSKAIKYYKEGTMNFPPDTWKKDEYLQSKIMDFILEEWGVTKDDFKDAPTI
jgi:hypothetical protein